jgi:hypothetical protein
MKASGNPTRSFTQPKRAAQLPYPLMCMGELAISINHVVFATEG